jgi:Ca2+-binding EF-hand superfamily protein
MAMTPVQRRKWTNLFHVFDVNSDGLVSREDHVDIAGLASAHHGHAPGSAADKEFRAKLWPVWEALESAADRDGDQAVTLDEFLDYFDDVIDAPRGEVTEIHRFAVRGILDMVDLDGDEGLNRQEYEALLKVYRIDERLAEISFPRLDLDGDGYISNDELMRLYADWFHGSDPQAPGNYLFGYY